MLEQAARTVGQSLSIAAGLRRSTVKLVAEGDTSSLLAPFTKNQMIPKLGFDRLRSHLSNLHCSRCLMSQHFMACNTQDSIDTLKS